MTDFELCEKLVSYKKTVRLHTWSIERNVKAFIFGLYLEHSHYGSYQLIRVEKVVIQDKLVCPQFG